MRVFCCPNPPCSPHPYMVASRELGCGLQGFFLIYRECHRDPFLPPKAPGSKSAAAAFDVTKFSCTGQFSNQASLSMKGCFTIPPGEGLWFLVGSRNLCMKMRTTWFVSSSTGNPIFKWPRHLFWVPQRDFKVALAFERLGSCVSIGIPREIPKRSPKALRAALLRSVGLGVHWN